jgi:subtilisin family serine protease
MLAIARSLALLLLAFPLLAQPQLVLHRRDGSTIELKKPAKPHGYLVEFRGAPLAAAGTRSLSSYSDTFSRFRRDLGDLHTGGPKASAAPRITREFYRLFHGVAVALDESELASVRALPYVKAVHVDEPVEAHEDTTRIARIAADRVWAERGTRGAGVVVAVIDTGIDATHPALAGKVIGGYDFVDNDEDPSDEQGHGTHVAGIIAGEGAGVQGVAPDAKLLSYRVLDENGVGQSSAIIAALEWAADPDRDNDFSDHADVANLSLGSRLGNADSPTSLAADRAVQAGVVVCLSAGNTPGGLTIGSPAASRLAITVGASDANDRIPFWSSRGPAFPDLALKPEISAPGDEIVSAKMGGGTTVKSGTSMAAPHVTGAAALVLAVHSDWSPAMVKNALIESADAVDEEVMARGGGRLNVFTATGTSIALEPSVVSFGNGTAGAWSRSRMVRVTNRGNAMRTFTASSTPPAGVTLTAEPATFTLDAGASRDVVLTAAVAADATPPPLTRSHGGMVSFRTDDGAAQLPWVAIDAARVVYGYDAPNSDTAIVWRCEDDTATMPRYDGTDQFVGLLPYGRCGATTVSVVRDGERGGEATVLLETHDVTADLELQRSGADSTLSVTLAGVDSEGAPIQPTDRFGTPYYGAYFLDLPEDSLYDVDSVVTFADFPLRINTIPGVTIGASQALFDLPRHRIFSVHFPPLHGGIHSDVTLRSLPSDLHHARVDVAPQGERFELQSALVGFRGGLGGVWIGGGAIPLDRGWRGDVYVSATTNPDAWAAPAITTGWQRLPDPELDLLGEAIRWTGDRMVMSNAKEPAAGAYRVAEHDTLHLGRSPLHARAAMEIGEQGFLISPGFFTPSNEWKLTASSHFSYEIRDAAGTLVDDGTANSYVSVTAPRGAYRATIQPEAGGTQLALSFDTRREDFHPPVLMSMRVLDADGAIAEGVAPGEPATLAITTEDAQTIRTSWRAAGGDWQTLATATLPTHVFGPVDLRIELEDTGGNTSTVTVPNAYSVGARRRSMRR